MISLSSWWLLTILDRPKSTILMLPRGELLVSRMFCGCRGGKKKTSSPHAVLILLISRKPHVHSDAQTFRSRWTTLFWWRKATPSRICLISLLTSCSLKASSSDTHWLKISPPAALKEKSRTKKNQVVRCHMTSLLWPMRARAVHTRPRLGEFAEIADAFQN